MSAAPSTTSATIDMTGIDRLPNGKWRLRKRVNKKPICNKVFATLEEAVRVRDAILRTLADEVMVPVDGMSLFHLGPRFLRSRINDRSYDDLVSRWNNHIKTARFATMPLDAVTTPMIYEWLDDLKAKDTAPDNRPKKKLGWGTRRHCRNHLNAFFKWAVRLGHVTSNPCIGVIVEREDGDEDDQWSPNWYLDAEDQTKLFALAKEFGRKEGSWVKFDAGTGLRGGEQWCLHLEDLHCVDDRPCTCVEKSDAPHIQVRFGSWDPDKGEYRSPKGRKGKRKDPRQVPLFGIALEAIREWLPHLARRKNRHGLLFPGPRGGRRTRPPKWFTRLGKALPIPRLQGRRIWWHLLRHTCATALVNGWWGTRWALQDAQKILGHSSVKVTEQYAHLTAGAVQEMAT